MQRATHIGFNGAGQVLGSRIVRQTDKRLRILGVVHTHPGSLRHPSDGDFQGDSRWVPQLRGNEGIFGIGTADGATNGAVFSYQPRPHVQCLGEFPSFLVRVRKRRQGVSTFASGPDNRA